MQVFAGIDVGTQGVRGIAVSEDGDVLASGSVAYASVNLSKIEGYREQSADDWWDATLKVLEKLGTELSEKNLHVDALSVDGTSGTIIGLKKDFTPACNALMYNDTRGDFIPAGNISAGNTAGNTTTGVYKALGRITWCRENVDDAAYYIHQADYINGKLTGEYLITDWSNALKSGYDLKADCWTADAKKTWSGLTIPKVVAPGTLIGTCNFAGTKFTAANVGGSAGSVTSANAGGSAWYKAFDGCKVVAGASDGYMSAVSTCAVNPGEWASIIGTTLVLKGVTEKYIDDPSGVVYCHKSPKGYWMPGGASNVGGRCLNEWFDENDFARLDKEASGRKATGKLVYPLLVPGERYPFVNPTFAGFGEHDDYRAVLEGVGYVEKLCFEGLKKLGCEVGDTVYTTGGAAKSDVWLQIRADILNKTLKVPAVTDAAIGGAMLAAGSVYYKDLEEATAHIGRIAKTIKPEHPECYEEYFEEFRRKAGQYA